MRQKARIAGPDLRRYVLSHYFELTTPIFNKEMGKRLQRARNVMKLTQRELAEQLGLSQANLSRLENGKMTNAPCSSAKFSSVLGKHFEYVLTRSGYYKYEDVTEEYSKLSRAYIVGLKRNRNVL